MDNGLPHIIESLPTLEVQGAAIKMLVLVDGDWEEGKGNIEKSLQKMDENYKSATDGEVSVSWQVEYKATSFNYFRWRRYGPYPSGRYLQAPDRGFLASFIDGEWRGADKPDAHCIVLIIHESNWKESATGGYEMGVWFSDDGRYSATSKDYPYRIQIIRASERSSAWRIHRVMSMELAHALDDFARRVGINVTDKFDYDVIHDPKRHSRSYRGVIAWLHELGMFEKAFPIEEEEEIPLSLEDRVEILENDLEEHLEESGG